MSDLSLNTTTDADGTTPRRKNRFRAAFAKDRKAQFGVVVLGLFVLGALLAPSISPYDPNAMTLATVDASGLPDARTVLLKGHDASGF